MSSCCKCAGHGSQDRAPQHLGSDESISAKPRPSAGAEDNDFPLLSESYIKKHFKVPPPPLYLDSFRKPLISFPIQGESKHFTLGRKYKINQQILDGTLDPCEAISSDPPYSKPDYVKRKTAGAAEDEEIIYILQLPDMETHCPIHDQTIRIPRFIWHSCKKPKKGKVGELKHELKQGGGPLHKPKPWLLSRHTDFDLLSQW